MLIQNVMRNVMIRMAAGQIINAIIIVVVMI